MTICNDNSVDGLAALSLPPSFALSGLLRSNVKV